jgi:pSer/pThr/pTyr-binding forkhead associated (FHA) protein
MAKLFLKFQERVLREVVPTGNIITIGRQPDNLLCIDNPAVSGHHAKVYWEADHYVVEDLESFNGTYLNNERIAKSELRDGDVVLIGKHTVYFRAEANGHIPAAWSRVDDRAVSWQRLVEENQPPQLDRTMVLDTKRVREMLGKKHLAISQPTGVQTLGLGAISSARNSERRIGTLTVAAGRTDRERYLLLSKLVVIGRSQMATVRLRRWFAPQTAASIHHREDGYFLAAAGKKTKIKVNGTEMTDAHQELNAGDAIEVAGITATFDYEVLPVNPINDTRDSLDK